jgi:hypothetical protein
MTASVRAADTDTISVTVSLESVLSVTVTPDSWSIGAIALSGTSGPSTFTATVGNSATKLEIVGADGAGGWTIASTPGLNQFSVTVTSPTLTLTKTYQVLAASVAAYGSKLFSLTYAAPSSDDKGAGVSQNFTITVRASTP